MHKVIKVMVTTHLERPRPPTAASPKIEPLHRVTVVEEVTVVNQVVVVDTQLVDGVVTTVQLVPLGVVATLGETV